MIRGASLVLLIAIGAVLLVAPTQAHPEGAPPTARISMDATGEVTLRWQALPDDLAVFAVTAGAADPSVIVDAPDAAEVATVMDTPEVAARALEVFAVAQDGPCSAMVDVGDPVTAQGLTVRFACDDAGRPVDVTIAALHDVDPRYRTVAGSTSPDGDVVTTFTVDEPTHRLTLAPVGVIGGAGADTPAAISSLPREEGPGRLADATGVVLGAAVLLAAVLVVAVLARAAGRRREGIG